MSMTKNNPAFDSMMEEVRMADERSYDEYLSEQYFRSRLKGQMTDDPPVIYGRDPGDEQP